GAARSVGNTPERSCRPGYRGGVRPTAPRALRDSGIRLLATDFTVRVQPMTKDTQRSEEHTSELQSLTNLVCRLLLEKKKEISFGTHKELRTATGCEKRGDTDWEHTCTGAEPRSWGTVTTRAGLGTDNHTSHAPPSAP